MPTVKIVRLETVKRGTNATLFDPYTDPITLRMTIMFSPDTVQITQPKLKLTFQIIALQDNQVKFQQTSEMDVSPSGGEVYAWVDLGTAHALGLQWTASQLFGFRGAVQIISYQGDRGEISVDACAVADPHWFQLEAVYAL